MLNVIQFRARDIRRDNRGVHERLQSSLAQKSDAELDAEYLRLVTADAWDKFQLATQAMVAAQDAMNEAHKRWLSLSQRLNATT